MAVVNRCWFNCLIIALLLMATVFGATKFLVENKTNGGKHLFEKMLLIIHSERPDCTFVSVGYDLQFPQSKGNYVTLASFTDAGYAAEDVQPFIDKGYGFRNLPFGWSSKPSVGNCVVNVIAGENSRELHSKLLTLTSHIRARNIHHRFVFLMTAKRGGELQTALLSSLSSAIRFKIGAYVDDDDNLRLLTVCHFCRDSKPLLVDVIATAVSAAGGDFPRRPRQLMELLFPDFTKDLHGYRLVVSSWLERTMEDMLRQMEESGPGVIDTFYRVGIEIALKINATFVAEIATDVADDILTASHPNGSWAGQFGQVVKGRAGLVVGPPARAGVTDIVGNGNSYYRGYFTYVAGKPRPLTPWKVIFWPFHLPTWIMLMLTMLTLAAAMTLISHCKRMGGRPLYMRYLSQICASLVAASFPTMSRDPVPRYLWAIWWVICLSFKSGYEKEMYTFMTIPPRETLPDFPDGIAYSDFDVGTQFELLTLAAAAARGLDSPALWIVFDRIEAMVDLDGCLNECRLRKFACVGPNLLLDMEYGALVDIFDEPLLVIPPDVQYAPSWYCMLFSVDIVFSETEHWIHSSITEGGLEMKYTSDYVYHRKMARWSILLSELDKYSRVERLTKEQLQGAFWCAAVGFTIAFIAFIYELASQVKKK